MRVMRVRTIEQRSWSILSSKISLVLDRYAFYNVFNEMVGRKKFRKYRTIQIIGSQKSYQAQLKQIFCIGLCLLNFLLSDKLVIYSYFIWISFYVTRTSCSVLHPQMPLLIFWTFWKNLHVFNREDIDW